MSYDQCKSDAAKARKDMKIGPFEVCRRVFSAGEDTAHMSLADKSDLFFHDYSLAPLFVQENYLNVRPAAAGYEEPQIILLKISPAFFVPLFKRLSPPSPLLFNITAVT